VGAVGIQQVPAPHSLPQAPSQREGDSMTPLRGESSSARYFTIITDAGECSSTFSGTLPMR